MGAPASRDLLSDVAVDRKPPANVAAKVGNGGARHERRTLADTLTAAKTGAMTLSAPTLGLASSKSSAMIVDVAIRRSASPSDIASRVSGESRNAMGAIVPPQSRKSNAAGYLP